MCRTCSIVDPCASGSVGNLSELDGGWSPNRLRRSRIHDRFPDLVRSARRSRYRSCTVLIGADTNHFVTVLRAAHPPPTRAARARSRASSECMRTPSSSAARSSRGSRSVPRLSISGPISSWSSPAITDATRLAIGVSGQAAETDRRADRRACGGGCGRSARRRSRRPGRRCRATRPQTPSARGRAGEELDHVALVDRARAVAAATPARRAPAGARRAARGSGTSASRRRSRSRPGTRPSSRVLRAGPPRRRGGWRDARTAGCSRGTSPPR